MRIQQYRDAFAGQTALIIGGAVTTVDYAQLATNGPDVVVLVNWAIRLAGLFDKSRHVPIFFTWHLEVFRHLYELSTPNLRVGVYTNEWLPPNFAGDTIEYASGNVLPYELYLQTLEDWAVRGKDRIDMTGCLHSCANSTLLALMFLWYAGCTSIKAVGMHDIGGVQAETYDPRLFAETVPERHGQYYRAVVDFCRIMGLPVEFLE